MGERYQLYHGDCLEVLPTLEADGVDLVFTSPPYNMRTRIRNGQYTEKERSDHFSKKYKFFHDALPIDDYYFFHTRVIEQLLRLSKTVIINIQIVTGSKEAWFKIIGDFNKQLKDIIIWDKGSAEPAMHGSVINRGSEMLLLFESQATCGRAFSNSYFQRGKMNDIWRLPRGSNLNTHGATFPISLAKKAIQGWCPENGQVLDPFMGLGSTGAAAMLTGRRFVGIELIRDYFRIAEQRIKNAAGEFVRTDKEKKTGQMSLFDEA